METGVQVGGDKGMQQGYLQAKTGRKYNSCVDSLMPLDITSKPIYLTINGFRFFLALILPVKSGFKE